LLKDIIKSYRPTQPLYGRSLFWFNSHTIKQKSEYSWNYYNQDSWEDSFPECGSNMQSPIDLKNDITDIEITDQNELEFSIDYKEEKKFLLSFNDYGVRMTLTRKDADKIYFKDDHKTFIFQEAQFHWGRKSNEGSEHTINGVFFDLEMHLIHKSLDGEVAIIALLISEAEADCHSDCIDYLSKINDVLLNHSEDSDFNFVLLNTDDFIKKAYYKYEGSLTTPPCTESVTWYIFETLFKLNPETSPMREFRKLQMHNIRRQKDRNYRYISHYLKKLFIEKLP
jgi:carbonic anhydrase